jgi:hypothetical protein
MKSNTHPNEWVRDTSQPQSMVQSCRIQDETRTYVIPYQP